MESSLRSDISRIYGRIGNDFMNQNEIQWDKLLKIKTTGRDDSRSDQYRYPYEPTQYCVLERLANNGLITKKNVLLDYGTGKGRVCFYLSYQTRCRSIGVEYDERIFESAEANREHAVSGRKVSFELTSAENIQSRLKWTDVIFLIRFLWRSCAKFLLEFMSHIMRNQEKFY